MRVLITGGRSDIGHAIAARRLERGDGVVITASSAASLPQALVRLTDKGYNPRGIVFDLAQPEASSEAVEALVRDGVDALVLNAWARRPPVRRFHELPMTSLVDDVQRNLLGNCWLIQRVLPGMLQRGFGRIVFVSSVSTALGTARYSSYVLGKSAMEGLMRSLAVEYGAHNVLANTVRLGLFKTERTRRFWGDASYVSRMSAVIPMGALGEPHQVGHALDPLLAEDQYLNGAVVDVGGGLPMFCLDRVLQS
jgi:NAD(P)-dependent dehydrogenase (short-subunit alcohol dehydrogenase family)